MTPEEHEKYIASLERRSEEAVRSWKRQRRHRAAYPVLLLAATGTTLWLIYKTVEIVLTIVP